ncbi:MAG TPA: FAD-dependent oxidoreductase [Candidatus Saccharimonadales bacterium]|nr:FAD-dependent oxidoreductase [Candidatus Saccharimonadales bacterium]
MIQNVKLVEKKEVAAGTMAFYFEKPEGLDFRAGQFADYTLLDPPETDDEGNTRGFSFITAPYEDKIGLTTRMRDTAFKRVLKGLSIGSEVKFDGPYGDYTLHKTETTPAVFVIGGVGVTPVRSIVAQATHDWSPIKITLLHSNRTPADAPFTEDFERFAKENPNFTFVPVITDSAPDSWHGEHGRIDADMLKRHVPDLSTPIFYLSGPEGMVKTMRSLLIEIGANEDNIRTEEFTGY